MSARSHRTASSGSANRRDALFCLAAIAVATLLAYAPIRNAGFVNYDDPSYVTRNPHVFGGLSVPGIAWAFTTTTESNWHPLTWVSLMIDASLGGASPRVFHATNVLLHLANALLLLLVLWRMTGSVGKSAFVAGLFALHPLHVESVAWITERKDVLSTLFLLLTIAAYARYSRTRSPVFLYLASFTFLCGLLAKPMLVSLPFVLLLLDRWPLDRWRRIPLKALLREKTAFFVLAAASCGITLFAQRMALKPLEVVSLGQRVANALVAPWAYIGAMLWPARLAIFYPIAPIPLWQPIAALVLLVAVSFAALRLVPGRPWILVGWFWFLVTLLPVIGIVQVGLQARADRYTYVPLIGLFLVVAWEVPELARRAVPRLGSGALAAAGVVILLSLGVRTYAQVETWRSSVALFEHAIAVTKDNALAQFNLSDAYSALGDDDAQLVHLREALRIDPHYADAHFNLTSALIRRRQLDEVARLCREEEALWPTEERTLVNLGILELLRGDYDAAERRLLEALRVHPDSAVAAHNLVVARAGRARAGGEGTRGAMNASLRPARARAGWALLLVLLTVVAYLPAIRGGFIWDDDAHVTENRNLESAAGLSRIWLDPMATPQYYPLVHTTFWIERHLFGLTPFGYHLDNVLLHALNAILLWLLLARLSVPGAWLAAAIFALHPVEAESVAWITERKNVLSGTFYLATVVCLLRWYWPERRTRPSSRWYAIGFALYVCALLSKTVTATLPGAVLLVLWWKQDRVRARQVVALLPMVAAGAALGAGTLWLEKHHVGAQGSPWALSGAQRCLLAGRALWFYAGKLVWPANLVFVYPRWQIDPASWWQYLFPAGAIAVIAALFALRGRIGKGPLVAVLCFGGTLLPALGFFDVFPMLYSWVADHFQYLASAALIALLSATLVTALRRFAPLDFTRGVASSAAAAALLATLGTLTWFQGFQYASAETLWRTTIAKNAAAWMAHCNLGTIYYLQGDDAKAEPFLRESLRLMPGFAPAHFTLTRVLMNRRNLAEAARMCTEQMSSWPTDERTLEDQGLLALLQGRTAEAKRWFVETIRAHPDSATAHANLADILTAEGRKDEAQAHLAEVARIVGAEKAAQAGRP